MNMKKSKSVTTSLKERHFGVLLEDLHKKFDLSLEGNEATRKELKDFRHEVRADIGFLKFGQKVLTQEIGDIKSKLSLLEDKYDKNFDQILKYLSVIDNEIQDLKTKLSKKADVERLENLEKRVAQMELVVQKYYDKK
jgi:DNA repair ATPase RecN